MPDLTELLTATTDAVVGYGDAREAARAAADQVIIDDLTAQVADLTAQLAAARPLLIGARVGDIAFAQANLEVGPISVTRLFHHSMPPRYSREGIPAGVKLIVSCKDTMNLTNWIRSIPAGEDVEVCYHHEPEGDYPAGATFVSEFNAAQAIAQAANPAVPFVFIGGGYQYGAANRKGYDGSFLPPAADAYYLDSYQPTRLVPAAGDPSVQRYIALLSMRGKQFGGFTEYGRGATDSAHPLTDALVKARLSVLAADQTYLRSLPAVRVWSYWYTDDSQTVKRGQLVKQWRLTDAASQQAWRTIARSVVS